MTIVVITGPLENIKENDIGVIKVDIVKNIDGNQSLDENDGGWIRFRSLTRDIQGL